MKIEITNYLSNLSDYGFGNGMQNIRKVIKTNVLR